MVSKTTKGEHSKLTSFKQSGGSRLVNKRADLGERLSVIVLERTEAEGTGRQTLDLGAALAD